MAMVDTETAADLRALSDAVRLDLKPLCFFPGIGLRSIFDGGEMVRSGVDVSLKCSSLSGGRSGCSLLQSCELAICRSRWSEEERIVAGEMLLKSSVEDREGIDSAESDLAESIPASRPSLPTIICPSTNPSMLPNSPSNCGFAQLPDKLPSLLVDTSSLNNLLKSATWSTLGIRWLDLPFAFRRMGMVVEDRIS